jgi:hypothetical protein
MHIFTEVFHQKPPLEDYIEIKNQALFLHNKEQEIYESTLEFEKKNEIICSFDYLFYNLQISCEFLERFKDDFNLTIN